MNTSAVKPNEKPVPYYQLKQSFDFPRMEKNVIRQDTLLAPFFDLLKKLEDKSLSAVTVTHIGDSHIQADFETGMIRRLFQQFFGGAGRGLITPLKLANTNEPKNYKISSPQYWTSVRCIRPGNIPFGLTGLVLQLNDSVGTISVINMEETQTEGAAFKEVIVYYDTQAAGLFVPDTTLLAGREVLTPYAERIVLKEAQSYIDLEFRSLEKKEITFYGLQLRNDRPGILYNAIGINGAHYSDYSREKNFAEQVSSLHTDLFILSMGINEAYDKGFTGDMFYVQIDSLVQQLKATSPQATILLTTPAESWKKISRKSRVPHPNIEIARNTIVRYAKDHGMPCWDLFMISGGKGSAHSWSKFNLFSRDAVHFTAQGYEYQGELLFQAIYNAYKEYLKK